MERAEGESLPLGDQESVGRNAQRGVMVEAAPSASLIVPEPDLLLELLIVALNAPAQFGKYRPDGGRRCSLEGSRASIWSARSSPSGHSISSHSSARPSGLSWRCPDANTQAHKARGQPIGRAFAPLDRAPSFLRHAKCNLLDPDQVILATAPFLRSSFAARLRPRPGRPDQGVRLNAGRISQPQRRETAAQLCVIAIGGIHQHHAVRKTGLVRSTYLIERDLRLSLEADVRRNTHLAPPLSILRPVLRQVQPIDHWQAGVMVGDLDNHTAT